MLNYQCTSVVLTDGILTDTQIHTVDFSVDEEDPSIPSCGFTGVALDLLRDISGDSSFPVSDTRPGGTKVNIRAATKRYSMTN